MKLQPHRSKRLWILMVLSLMTACLKPPAPGVGVNSLTADIIFGIPDVDEPVLPPNIAPEFKPIALKDPSGPIEKDNNKPKVPCPEATVNDVAVDATVDVKSKPPMGISRWKVDGKSRIPGTEFYLDLPKFTQRAVYDVRDLEQPGDFTFSVLQEEAGGGSLIGLSFDVISSRPRPSTPVNAVRDNSSLNGIFLRLITRYDASGNANPSELKPPLTWLPLPVVPGVTFTTTSSDPKTFTSVTHSGKIVERRRYDACGEMVDSWFIDGQQTVAFFDPATQTNQTVQVNFDYGIATQLGGMSVFERYDKPCANFDAKANKCQPDPELFLTTNIGTLKPEPLPEDFLESD